MGPMIIDAVLYIEGIFEHGGQADMPRPRNLESSENHSKKSPRLDPTVLPSACVFGAITWVIFLPLPLEKEHTKAARKEKATRPT